MAFSRLKLYLSMIRYADSNTERFAQENVDFFRRMQQDLKRYGIEDVAGLRVLDIGCGKHYWYTLLLRNWGAKVTGIDVEYVRPGYSPAKYVHILRTNGLERTAKTLYWDVIYSRAYYRALEKAAGRRLTRQGLDVQQQSITETPVPDNTFDLIVSHEVFEHLPDIPASVAEMKRIMKPGALTYIYVHNYASVSGGHHIAWKYPDENPSATVPPWDHLRQNRFPEIPSWINRQREHVYREAFEREFKVLEWITHSVEGEALLTPVIREELSDYSQEELLKKGFIIIARKKV